MDPIVVNCNPAGEELLKRAEIQLVKNEDSDNQMHLIFPTENKPFIFDTQVVGYLSYKAKQKANETNLFIRKNKSTTHLYNITEYLRQHIDKIIDNDANMKSFIRVYYGFSNDNLSFKLDPSYLQASSSFQKIKFKWTLDITVNQNVVNVQLRVISVEGVPFFSK